MLTTPVFRPWRPIWDAALGPATRRLDELAAKRQKGRQVPPPLKDWSDVEHVLLALHMAKGRISSLEFIQDKIIPLLRASVWPRWLLLEAALDQSSNSGDLHLSALILRSQIEELDALRTAATVFLRREEEGLWDAEAMAGTILTLMNRVLPRIQPKTEEQLVERAHDAALAAKRPESLQRAFDRLSEYVHPNYGSHILSVRPHSIEAAKVIVEAFTAIYEEFLCLPWAKDGHDGREDPTHQSHADSRDPYLILADDTIPALKPAFRVATEEQWNHVAECFRHRAAYEENWADFGAFPTDVEAIRALRENSVPSNSWPEMLRTVAGRTRYAFLVEVERQLAADAESFAPGTAPLVAKARLSLLLSSLTFAINVTEYKIDSLARQAARLINAGNMLGATLAVRSLLEHHAVAIELGTKLKALWERAERAAPCDQQVTEALDEAEKQVARVLAGSSGSPEQSTPWRALWRDTVRKPYNVLGPIKDLDAKQPGFLKTYGLLSHVVHGTVCTGGDLLGTREGGWKAGSSLLAQLVLFLGNVCGNVAMLNRQATPMRVAYCLDITRRHPQGAGAQIKAMRILEGQKLKPGRDIFGSGTESDPYRFRNGLLYHDAYYHYLKQEGIQVRQRTLAMFSKGFGDKVETEDGRVLYFLNDKMNLE